jgi:hypothetical protein
LPMTRMNQALSFGNIVVKIRAAPTAFTLNSTVTT